jgi:hypothetical protein
MVDRASKAPSLFSSVSHLGRAVRDLFRTIKDKESSLATNAEAHHEEVETSLASRQNEPNCSRSLRPVGMCPFHPHCRFQLTPQ